MEVEKYISIGGQLSDTTMMELASFIESTEVEKKRILADGLSMSATDEEKAFVLGGE